MTGKKIIANLLLLSSLIGLNGYFSRIQAVVSKDEWNRISSVEEQRHDPRLQPGSSFKENLISDIAEKIPLKENTNIVFYYLSVFCKLLGGRFKSSTICWCDKAFYEKEFFATWIYRILSNKISDSTPINPQELSYISDFLAQKVKSPDDFKNFNDMDKLNITRICLIFSEHNILDKSTLNRVLEIIGRFITTDHASPKLLITFGKIPHNTNKQIEALNKAIGILPTTDLRRIEAFIALGKIPHDPYNQIVALNEAIRILPPNDPRRIEALIALGKIPHNPYNEIVVLTEAIRILSELRRPQNDPQRIEAFIALSKIPGPQQLTFGVKYLKEIIEALPPNDPQRIEALLALAKIPHNIYEQINALEELSSLQNPTLTQQIEEIAHNITSHCKLTSTDHTRLEKLTSDARQLKYAAGKHGYAVGKFSRSL